jgi:hypothetical protein
MLFKDGQDEGIKFTAPRDKDSIINWLKEQTGLTEEAQEGTGDL